jgi:uncharacterized protein YjbI with pentapeptide repeats
MARDKEPLLHLSKAGLERQKALLEVRKLQREEGPIRRWLGASGELTALVSLIVSLASLGISGTTAFSQWRKTREELQTAQAKQFADLIQAAADSKRGEAERIGAIWLLGGYWAEAERANVVANVLCGIIVEEEKNSVMAACVGAIGLAYVTPESNWQRIKELLYGKSDGSRQGTVLFAQALVRGVPTLEEEGKLGETNNAQLEEGFKAVPLPPDNKRLHYLCQAVRQGRKDLKDVYLQRAHLEDIELQEANLQCANLRNAHLQRAAASEIHLENALLNAADLTAANLTGADLTGAHLEGARLMGAHLTYAHPERPGDHRPAKLQGAHLQEANLERADLRHADLQGANLQDADLEGAVVSNKDDLNGAIGHFKGTVIHKR